MAIPSTPLIDAFGRVHTNLRISVTDRCNIRCFYCMPDEAIQFKPRDELLTFEEIERFARAAASVGVNKLRLTGGEPLVRSNLELLIAKLVAIPGIKDVALTTNGVLLGAQAPALKAAGLHRLNVSLDTLNEETFRRIARRQGIDRILEGLFIAKRAGFDNIRLNAIAIKSLTEAEIVPLARFSREHDFELRFIEFMPLDADQAWQSDLVLNGEKIRELIEAEFGPLVPAARPDPSQPAFDYQFADGAGKVGFINPVSQPFCGDCNRLRITAEGKVRNCLFSTEEWDVRHVLRNGGDDAAIIDLLRESIAQKKPGHGIDSDEFLRPQRSMYQIGG
ncbi:MAG: GTP 3',8-cyclase MoaA [bacterium]|nr:GTP 3',8-cyclase MoaA [bacterium]